jgi:tRNA G10  N-methylase Trm11
MKHPAKYTDLFLPIFAEKLKNYKTILDPFAGTGKIAEIKKYGYVGKIICNEIEKEWAVNPDVDEWHIGDAEGMNYLTDNCIDAICTSPTYGNRMADHFEAKDNSHRITYRHYLGRRLNDANTGKMQWGEKYKEKHKKIFIELKRVLKEDGILIINISDHIRAGKIIPVVGWYIYELERIGFRLVENIEVKTPRNKFGKNRQRVDFENVLVFNVIQQRL